MCTIHAVYASIQYAAHTAFTLSAEAYVPLPTLKRVGWDRSRCGIGRQRLIVCGSGLLEHPEPLKRTSGEGTRGFRGVISDFGRNSEDRIDEFQGRPECRRGDLVQ